MLIIELGMVWNVKYITVHVYINIRDKKGEKACAGDECNSGQASKSLPTLSEKIF